MAEKSRTDQNRSLEQFVDHRRAAHRPTGVHIEGDMTEDPPEGRATAMRVANLLQRDEGRIVEPTPAEDGVQLHELPENSVVLYSVSQDPDPDTCQWEEVTPHLVLARRPLVHVVIHSRTAPPRVEKLLDARVCTGEDGVQRVAHLRTDPFDPRRTVEVGLGGLVADV